MVMVVPTAAMEARTGAATGVTATEAPMEEVDVSLQATVPTMERSITIKRYVGLSVDMDINFKFLAR